MTTRWADFCAEDEDHDLPPKRGPQPLKNPYMEGIEAVEGILKRLQTVAKEFPQELDKALLEEYSLNMLEVRDTLHRFRQAEMGQ